MSCDLARLKSASALRDWEESRAKNFSAWCKAARRLLDNLQASVQLGASQHAQLQLLLSQRSAADKAYAQALVRMPEQEGDVASERNFHLQPWAYRLRFTCQCSPLSGRGAPPRTYTCASG
ncbi:unnamed protein product [Durusdinium trenchii]|uniref:Uncharacterized protein n=1 Tax=Durusdinium trenchii TaxID=1381693 RepID=A0ABP0LL95_9DINO